MSSGKTKNIKQKGAYVLVRLIILFAIGLTFLGCKEKTEEQQLAKFKSSLRYKTYKLASEELTEHVTSFYNKSADEQIEPEVIHATLSIIWFTQQRGNYSYIEADFLDDMGCNDYQQFTLALKTIALHQMGLKQLSRSHYEILKEQLAAGQEISSAQVELQHKLLLSSLIAVGFLHNDWSMAGFAAESLQAITGVNYIVPLVGTISEARTGNPVKAFQQLRDLAANEHFTGHVRTAIEEAAEKTAAFDGGDKEQFMQDIIALVSANLLKQIIDDIFTAEEKGVLLSQVKAIPEKIAGQQEHLAEP